MKTATSTISVIRMLLCVEIRWLVLLQSYLTRVLTFSVRVSNLNTTRLPGMMQKNSYRILTQDVTFIVVAARVEHSVWWPPTLVNRMAMVIVAVRLTSEMFMTLTDGVRN